MENEKELPEHQEKQHHEDYTPPVFEKKALELLKKCKDITLTSVSEEGYPRTCYLARIAYDSYYEVYVSTGKDGTKVRHFTKNPKASVCYRVDGNSVTLSGDVSFVTDLKTKKRFWAPWMEKFFPDGAESEEFCVLKFTGTEATFWINHEFLRDYKITPQK